MADRAFYRPPSSPHEWQWGDRHYFYNCHREGGDFAWFKDNLNKAEGSPMPENITPQWAFAGKWDPEATTLSLLPSASFPAPRRHAFGVNGNSSRLVWIPGRGVVSHRIYFGKNVSPDFRNEQTESSFDPGKLESKTKYFWRVDEITDRDTVRGNLWDFTTQ
jgi:hypothetical protein